MNLNYFYSTLGILFIVPFLAFSNPTKVSDGKNINAPDLQYVSHLIDDDDNGTSNGDADQQPEPGESIEMPVSVVNNGDQLAHNVTVSLFCADPDINITDDSESIGDIGIGETDWTLNDFDFEVALGTPEKDVTFTLTINADEGVWQNNFTVHIFPGAAPPNLVYHSHTIDDDSNGDSNGDGDGQVEAGESIEMPLAIINTGGLTAHYVSGYLSCADPDIDVTDNEEYFGSVAEGVIDWTNNDFDFDVNPSCPEKDVVFSLNIVSDEGSWTSEFTIHIFDAGLPNLAFSDFLIDDDDNNDSNGDGDGIPESGESIELPVSIVNTGEAIANNVSAILSCTDPDINITDQNESFGDILVGQENWCNFNYNFDINPTCPDKTVTFVLSITSDEGSWTSSFDIDIVHPGSPDLNYANHLIDDDASGSSNGDGDGIPEAGETVEIPIQIQNSGVITATGVSATISSSDPDINITDPFEYFPDVAVGALVWCENDYDIEIAANCPEKDVVFTLTVVADQGSWTDSFIIHISEQGMPQLSFGDFIIDDDNNNNSSGNDNGMAEPGEHIELPIQIQNIGEGDAHNVSAVLSTNDAFVTVTDANENYGTIAAGTSDWSNNEFDFSVSSNCPEKDVIFTLTISSDEGVWTSNFTVHIFITGSPDLIYSSHIIDDDNDGTSSGDGDGQAEPGENIEMPLAIENIGSALAHNVVAQLTCADADITITDDTEYFGSILPGEIALSNLDFDFTVAFGTIEKDVVFNLSIQSDEGFWTDSFIVHIFPSTGAPNLAYLSHLIDDDDNGASNGNGDGVPSAGESIEMPILISNTGTASAHSITAALSCSDSDISITDNSESYPDLNVGETAWSNYQFDFDVSPTCPDKTVVFVLQITSDEGSWTSSFSQLIVGAGSPHLVFSSFTIDDDQNGESSGDGDGLAEPDESIELPLMIANIGDGPVHNVYGTLSTTDIDITINDNYEFFGDVSEGSSAWTNNDFDFYISETCPEKDVLFNLSLEGDEGIWNVSFSLHITPHVYYQVTTYSNPTNGGTTDGGGSYMEGESCSVNAQAADGHSFLYWSKDGNIVSNNETYTFIVEENTALIAHFQIEEYLVTVNANPPSGGSVDGEGIYQYGESATVTATPNADYTFVEWTMDGETVSTNESYTFPVQQNTNLTAHFQGELYIINVDANPSNGGNVSGGGEYAYGETATVTATPLNNFEFINWTENGSVVSSDASYSFTVTSNRNLIANFSEDYFVVDAIAVPAGAAEIAGAGNYAYGQYCSLQANPNGGYYFIDWKENGQTISVNPTYYFQVTEDRNLEAHLGVFDYEITTVAYPAEAGSVDGGGNFNYGEVVTVTAVANTGWEFLSWTNNGSVVSNEAIYTFNVTASLDLQANFIVSEYLVSAIADPGSGGSIDGDGIYEYGETATLVASPANAYVFLNWTEDGDVVSEDLEYSFSVSGDRSFVAHFAIQQFEILTQASPAYGGETSGGGVYEYGSSITVSAMPNNSYEFVKWIEDGNIVSTNMNYSFSVLENRDLTAVFQFVIGVEDIQTSSIIVYPNPSDGIFVLDISEEVDAQLFSSQGNVIWTGNLSSGKQELDLTQQADGLYFLSVKGEKSFKVLKILKE